MPDFAVGDSAQVSKRITEEDVTVFAGLSGDRNPLHLDATYAAGTRFGRRVVHGMLTASLISTVIGMHLPGPGAIYVSQTLHFLAPVYLDDTITAIGTLTEYERERGRMLVATLCSNQHGEDVVTGEAVVLYRPT